MEWIRVLLNDGWVELPIAYSDTWLSDERLPYDLIETNDDCYFEIRKTMNGALVAFDVTYL